MKPFPFDKLKCIVDGDEAAALIRQTHADYLSTLLTDKERVVWELAYDAAMIEAFAVAFEYVYGEPPASARPTPSVQLGPHTIDVKA
jgi:hypothetical protein